MTQDWADRARQDRFFFNSFNGDAANIMRAIESIDASIVAPMQVGGGITGDSKDVSGAVEVRKEIGEMAKHLAQALKRLDEIMYGRPQ